MNTTVQNKSTGLSPFEDDIGYTPSTLLTRSLGECEIQSQSAIDYVKRRSAYRIIAQDNISKARADQKFYADEGRRHVLLKTGDLLTLKTNAL